MSRRPAKEHGARHQRIGACPYFLALVLWLGCAGGEEAPPAGEPAAVAALAEPEGLEPAVREGLAERRERAVALGASASAAERAETWGALAAYAQAHNLLPTAREAYRRALAADPDSFRWTYLAAHVELRAGHVEAAHAGFTRALELRPADVAALVHTGRTALALARDDEARRLLERALELDPRAAAAHEALGRLATSRGEDAVAAERFRRALELQPHADRLHYQLGQALARLGQDAPAREHLARRGEAEVGLDDPLLREIHGGVESVGLLLARARGAFTAGDLDQAAAAASRALEIAPDDAGARLVAGAVAYERGRRDEAIEHFAEAVRLRPESSRASYGLGRALAASGREEEAIAALRQAVGLDPGLVQARVELGHALERAGRPAQAVAEYEAVLATSPLDAAVHLRRAFALIRAGRHAEARDRLRDDADTFPDEPAFAHALARLLAASPDDGVRDGERALTLLDGLREHLGGATGFAETLAMALAETRRHAEAARWQRQAIEVARRAGREELLLVMERRLALYEAGRACREPWSIEDEALRPPGPR